MSPDWPLQDMNDARDRADEALGDLASYLQQELNLCEGHYPPEGQEVLGKVAILRTQLAALFPPAFEEALAQEEEYMRQEAEHWEPSS
jgi:hypothetical protein